MKEQQSDELILLINQLLKKQQAIDFAKESLKIGNLEKEIDLTNAPSGEPSTRVENMDKVLELFDILEVLNDEDDECLSSAQNESFIKRIQMKKLSYMCLVPLYLVNINLPFF